MTTTSDQIAWLAGLEQACGGYAALQSGIQPHDSFVNCPNCNGTGTVARFPQFRVACKGEISYPQYHFKCGCSGKGWTPLAVEQVHLETVYLAAGDVVENLSAFMLQAKPYMWSVPQDWVDAAIAALYAAVQAEKGSKT